MLKSMAGYCNLVELYFNHECDVRSLTVLICAILVHIFLHCMYNQ